MPNLNPELRLLVVGYGDIGQRMQNYLPPQSQLWKLSRSVPPQIPYSLQTDIRELKNLPDVDWIFVTLTPDEDYAQTYVQGMKQIRHCLSVSEHQPRLVFVSSTRVYPQNAGEWIDVSSPTHAWDKRSAALLEAENLCLEYTHGMVVRFSGLYNGTTPAYLKKYQHDLQALNAYTNRIHRDDAARFLVYLTQSKQLEKLYLASDDHPALRQEIMEWWGWSKPQAKAQKFSGKRCKNTAMSASGFKLNYPDFKAGFAQSRAGLSD